MGMAYPFFHHWALIALDTRVHGLAYAGRNQAVVDVRTIPQSRTNPHNYADHAKSKVIPVWFYANFDTKTDVIMCAEAVRCRYRRRTIADYFMAGTKGYLTSWDQITLRRRALPTAPSLSGWLFDISAY